MNEKKIGTREAEHAITEQWSKIAIPEGRNKLIIFT